MSRYIPDWRYLLHSPRVGLCILEELEAAAWKCAKTTLKDSFYAEHFFGTSEEDASEGDLLMGLHFPPSVSQLHVHCILSPMLPIHYYAYSAHFSIDRFFPLEYVKRVLSLDECMVVDQGTEIQYIIDHFNVRVNYKDMHASFINRLHDRQRVRGVWDSCIFKGLVTEDNSAIFEKDRQKLMNYGTNGTAYYMYAKDTTVVSWMTPAGVAADARANRRNKIMIIVIAVIVIIVLIMRVFLL